MKLPLSWLSEYVDIGSMSADELADKLLNIGFEVEDIIYLGKDIKNVLTARITNIRKHPNADKLQICDVDYGFEQSVIVTAATNVFVGAVVPVARDNSDLPTGQHITTGVLRGETSYGMFCSGADLCIDNQVIDGAEINGILILPDDTPIGKDIKDVLSLNEYILDVSITANRPDCQSIIGISREIAALLGKKIKLPSTEYTVHQTDLTCPKAEITNENCSAYTGTVISDIAVAPSPKWMRDRLRYVGIRAINNIVDITNYVLVEVGQPLHAFDLSCVSERIEVRSAVRGEKITALNDTEYTLDDSVMLIADKDKPLAIAGIMGGEYSGINDNTQNVFLEAAKFARGNIRTSSRKLGLRSDSSARYEKGVDWFNLSYGRERALSLFDQIGAGKVTSASISAGAKPPTLRVINTQVSKINDLLGIAVPTDSMSAILNNLGIATDFDGDKMVCMIPLFRDDIDNYTDITEEIIRYYGYDKLESTFIVNARPTVGGKSTEQNSIDKLKDLMISFGAYEAATFSFINEKQYDQLCLDKSDPRRQYINILNPLSEEYGVMRTQLVTSMLNAVANNTKKKIGNFRLFEVAKVYIPKELPLCRLPDEKQTLGIVTTGEHEDFYSMKSMVMAVLHNLTNETISIERSTEPYLHPGISADIYCKDEKIGSFGKIHPTVAADFDVPENTYVAEICIQSLIGTKKDRIRFKALPKYPGVDRDIAIIVDDETSIGELTGAIQTYGGEMCEDIQLFDIYKGNQISAGKKSVAFSLKLRSDTHTLIDSEIQEIMNSIVNGLKKDFNAILR